MTLLAACHVASSSARHEPDDPIASAPAPPAPPVPPTAATASSNAPPVVAPGSTEPPPPPVVGTPITPDRFAAGEVQVESEVHTDQDRHTISPLLYGMNHPLPSAPPLPEPVLRGISFVRRGGDRANTYDWETNVSNGAQIRDWANDMYLAGDLARPSAPGEVDRVMIAEDLAGGRGSMVPFVLNGYVAGPSAEKIPYDQPGFDIGKWFRRLELVKPGPFSPSPDLEDGVVYTDEHLDFLRRQFPGDIYEPGATQVMIGSDNEPDLWVSNYPMLQRGSGAAIVAANGAQIGTRVTADEFTARYIAFARRVRQLEPRAMIVGPDHFHFDGYTNWHTLAQDRYRDDGRWYIDDFLSQVKAAGESTGQRLLDTWDMHWYPQPVLGGTFAWKLDDSVRRMTPEEIETVLQGPRSYWDPDYDEHSWITDDHLHGPARILERLFQRIADAWPGMPLGVTEYFPGGCSHVSSALGVADTLGVFGRMGVHIAAMWPHTCDLSFAFGGFRLLRNADGAGLRFGDTSVRAVHPEKAESSIYAATQADGSVTVLVINKTSSNRRFGLRLFHPALAKVAVHRVDGAHPAPFAAGETALSRANAYAYDAPALSASLLVFRP